MLPPPPTAPAPASAATTSRLDSVDLLRGIVIVLMSLDHVRDFFTNVKFDPLDLSQTNPALFMTRWITHFCAPVFIFLAGTGAALSLKRGKTKGDLSWFLLTRGLWLALLEITWVRCLGWEFNFNFHVIAAAVLWSIGWSMVVLAGLVFLPRWAIAAFGIALIAGHNALDAVQAEAWGQLGWLWRVLHQGGGFQLTPKVQFIPAYPLVPWIGVMAVGYAFAAILQRESPQRRREMFSIGAGLTLLFVGLRWTNVYGNPKPWTPQSNPLFTVFSFIDCHKYPPSSLYVLMTLGPALMLLAWLDRSTPRLLRPVLVFGRVPLFFYLLHLPLIHGLALVTNYMRYGRADWMFGSPFGATGQAVIPPNTGFGLPVVYLVWILVTAMLYPACQWFARLKRERKEAWLSYL